MMAQSDTVNYSWNDLAESKTKIGCLNFFMEPASIWDLSLHSDLGLYYGKVCVREGLGQV